MKRLITIFMSSIVGMCLWGQQQTLPMTVVGDVYVGETGIITSKGPVHLKTDGAGARVDNYGRVNMMDSVIFYTNDEKEGLLRNEATGQKVTAIKVAVRKAFVKSNAWYMLSFPFDVDLGSGVINPLNGQRLVKSTDFEVQYYNAQYRADTGTADDKSWQTYTGTTLKKGLAYRVAVKLTRLVNYQTAADTVGAYAGRFKVDFLANTPSDIEYLFAKQEKGYDLTYATGNFVDEIPYGWNAVGGLNSTNFLISGATIDYTGTSKMVYYRTPGDDKWYSISLTDPNAKGTLRPYGVLFLKTNKTMTLTRAGNGGFGFLSGAPTTSSDGISIESTSPIFRSSQSGDYEMLKLTLANANDATNKKFSHIYFNLDDSYSNYYLSSEDGIIMDTNSSTVLQEPVVWSIAKDAGNNTDYPLFSNSIPSGENEVPLGITIPVAGDYVFSLSEIFAVKTPANVILWDKITDTRTDLLKSDYTYHSNGTAGNAAEKNRFVITINKSFTGINQLSGADVYAYADNNVLTVKNLLAGDKVQVLDLTGRIIASGAASNNLFSTTLTQKGVYIVNVNGGKTLKVLNK